MNNIAVRTTTVFKGFGEGEARTEVLKEVNFEARMGELLMLVGPSGCGKRTLLSVIAGTLGVDRGEVWEAGCVIGRTCCPAASNSASP